MNTNIRYFLEKTEKMTFDDKVKNNIISEQIRFLNNLKTMFKKPEFIAFINNTCKNLKMSTSRVLEKTIEYSVFPAIIIFLMINVSPTMVILMSLYYRDIRNAFYFLGDKDVLAAAAKSFENLRKVLKKYKLIALYDQILVYGMFEFMNIKYNKNLTVNSVATNLLNKFSKFRMKINELDLDEYDKNLILHNVKNCENELIKIQKISENK